MPKEPKRVIILFLFIGMGALMDHMGYSALYDWEYWAAMGILFSVRVLG